MAIPIIKWRGTDLIKLPGQLTYMAKSGFRLRHIDPVAFYFDPAEPEDLQFRVLVINNAAELDEAYRLDGWRLVDYSGGFAIVCAPPGTPYQVVENPPLLLKKLHFMRTITVIRLMAAILGLAFVIPACLNAQAHTFWMNLFLFCMAGLLTGSAFCELLPIIRLQKFIGAVKKLPPAKAE